MNRIVPAIAILLTVASTSLATAELKLDTRHDIVPVATHVTPEAAKTAPQTATPAQVAAADHQAKATEPKPRPKKVQRKVRPRYEEQIIVVRPVFRPIFAGYRFGRRW